MSLIIKLKNLFLLSIVVIVLGLLLLIYMITVEDEPSPAPPLMIAAGLFWAFRLKSKINSSTNF